MGGRNIDQLSLLCVLTRTKPAAQACALMGIELVTFPFTGNTQTIEPHRSGLTVIFFTCQVRSPPAGPILFVCQCLGPIKITLNPIHVIHCISYPSSLVPLKNLIRRPYPAVLRAKDREVSKAMVGQWQSTVSNAEEVE